VVGYMLSVVEAKIVLKEQDILKIQWLNTVPILNVIYLRQASISLDLLQLLGNSG
jgi:hypothetical protein